MAYQHSTSSLARRMAPADAQDDLVKRLDDAARITRNAVPVMSEDESQLLSDFARGRGIVRISQWCGISERAFREADALAVSEAIRGHILARRRHRASGLLGLLEAFTEETQSNGHANEAQEAFLFAPSKATRDRAIETLHRQEVASRILSDLLHTTPIDRTSSSYVARQLTA